MSEKPIHLQKNTQQIVSKMSNTINQSLNIYQCAQTGGIRTCAASFGQIWRVCCFRASFVVENVDYRYGGGLVRQGIPVSEFP